VGTAAAVTLATLAKDAILKFIEKTRKLVIVHEEIKTCGFGCEVSAIVAEEGFDLLGTPIKRVAAPDAPNSIQPGPGKRLHAE